MDVIFFTQNGVAGPGISVGFQAVIWGAIRKLVMEEELSDTVPGEREVWRLLSWTRCRDEEVQQIRQGVEEINISGPTGTS